MSLAQRSYPRAALVVVVMGVALIALGVVVTLRGPDVAWVTFLIGGSTVFNGAAAGQPPERARRRGALTAVALALALVALVALVAAFL